MYNTVRLLKGTVYLVREEYKKFTYGDTILNGDYEPEEIKRWDIKDYEKAKEELKKYKCMCISYGDKNYDIIEYGLEMFDSDENGEFVAGSDYDLAENGELNEK